MTLSVIPLEAQVVVDLSQEAAVAVVVGAIVEARAAGFFFLIHFVNRNLFMVLKVAC